MMPGYGDEATWPPYCGAPGDPRETAENPPDQVEQSRDLLAEIRIQLDRADNALFCCDWEGYRLAMCNVADLSESAFV